MSATMTAVRVMSDEDGHWYIIPNDQVEQFSKDLSNENMVDSGDFDALWGIYRTGGDINLIQLYAEM